MLSNLSFVSQLILRKTLNAVVLLWAQLCLNIKEGALFVQNCNHHR
jgi:hypothetical protein